MRRGLVIMIGSLFACLVGVTSIKAQDDDALNRRYFEQLRRRGFYQLAESHAAHRLSDPLLSADRRIELVIELSRTFAAHAEAADEDQQPELWDRAAAVLAEELTVAESVPHRLLLQTYAALIPAARVKQLVWDLDAAPFEEPLRESLDRISADALERLQHTEKSLTDVIRKAEGTKQRPAGITVYELRRLASQIRLQTATIRQARARLSPPGSQERHSDLLDADEVFRKIISSNADDQQFAAKLGLVTGNRLREELDRAVEMLEAIEKELQPGETIALDALRLERARTWLAARKPDDAAQTLLQMRIGRDHLSGEFWLVYLQTLAALRRTATERNAPNIAAEVAERAEAALNDVDEQAGGSWSRRCRTIWSSAESMERYGLEITSLLSRGKSDYLAGKPEEAIRAYTSACELAREDGLADLEMDAGYTLVAILIERQRWDEAATRSEQLVAAHLTHPKAAEMNLLKLYALGRNYDQHRNDAHQTAYRRALSEHLQNFSASPTVPEVSFLLGQFLETSGDQPEAFAAYLKVPSDHARHATAIAAAARCGVAKLLSHRDGKLRDTEWERQISSFLARELKDLPEQSSQWSDPQVELAYHAVRTMLLIDPPAFTQANHWLNRLDQALGAEQPDKEPPALRAEIGRRVGPLRLIALAGQGRPEEAERLLGTLENASAVEQLAVLEELSQIDITSPELARRSLVEMQLTTAERLSPRRGELSAPQQRRFDLALANSYLETRQPAKAVAVYERMLKEHARELELARQLGEILLARPENECQKLAKTCWQQVERRCKQGSAEWLWARAHVIECHIQLEELSEARKLLKVTTLIYAQSLDDELQRRYAELASRLK